MKAPRLAIRAAGGSKMQEFSAGILPQVLPSWVATVLHRNDINLRGSVVLGYVGVAGLGLEMSYAFKSLNYGKGLGHRPGHLHPLHRDGDRLQHGARGDARRAKHTRSWIDRCCTRGSVRTTPQRHPPGARTGPPARRPRCGDLDGAARASHDRRCRRRARRDRQRRGEPDQLDGLLHVLGQAARGRRPVLAAVVRQLRRERDVRGHARHGRDRSRRDGAHHLLPSILLGSLAARNVAPSPGARGTARLLLVGIRGIPELILAIVLVVITGLGAQAGVIALAIGGIGLLGKLIADSFEEVDRGPERALRAVGATRLQTYTSATVPQGMQALIGHSFYMLDTNIRAATILGIVGGGGVGYYLLNASQGSRYETVTAIVLMILVTVLVVEGLAMWIGRCSDERHSRHGRRRGRRLGHRRPRCGLRGGPPWAARGGRRPHRLTGRRHDPQLRAPLHRRPGRGSAALRDVSRELWLRLAKDAGFWLRESGTLVAARHDDEIAVLEAASREGGIRLLEADELLRLAPLRADGLVGGAHIEVDCRPIAHCGHGDRASSREPRSGVPVPHRGHRGGGGPSGDHPGPDRLRKRRRRGEPRHRPVAPEVAERHGIARCALDMIAGGGCRSGIRSPHRCSPGWSLVRYGRFADGVEATVLRERLHAERPDLAAIDLNQMYTQLRMARSSSATRTRPRSLRRPSSPRPPSPHSSPRPRRCSTPRPRA